MNFPDHPPALSRRAMLQQMGAGFGSLALSALLADKSFGAVANPRAVRPPHFAPRAKRVIMLFMFGGPSHIDSFDPKPILNRDTGKPLPFAGPRVISFPRRGGNLIGSPFEFKQHGQSGTWVSELFPNIAGIVDDLTIIRSMHCSNPRHGGAVLEWRTGSDTFIRSAMGLWLIYGLRSENQNLPGSITICQALAEGARTTTAPPFCPRRIKARRSATAPEPPSRPIYTNGNWKHDSALRIAQMLYCVCTRCPGPLKLSTSLWTRKSKLCLLTCSRRSPIFRF